MTNYLDELNPAQRAAVEYCDGPSLVIAGAGSGKTRVLTYKIVHLLNQGLEPWSILALTFTNKAAREMQQRISSIVGAECSRRLWMGTFHSVFLRILRIEHEAIGFSSNFTIYDTDDSKSLVRGIIKEMGLDDKTYKASSILNSISNAKNQLVSAEEYVANGNNAIEDAKSKTPSFGAIFQRYANRCRQADAMDFDDILLFTYKLFEERPDICQKYSTRFSYVLVDEYQDTNFAQHRIVWQLTKDNQRVCVVGDDAQSIYSFRGANIDNILMFQDIYSNCRLFKLEQNYRSTQTIVEAANSLITKNKNQIHKDVFSTLDRGERITVTEAYSDIEEGQIIVRQLRHIKQTEQCDYDQFAILYRTNAQSRIFEDELRKSGCPYKIYGGLSFYQRKEIKDVIAYFRLAVNPKDEEALKRIINYPARGIGNTTVQKIVSAADANNTSLWDVVCDPVTYGVSINKGTLQKLVDFRDTIEAIIQISTEQNADTAGPEIMKKSGIIEDIYRENTPETLSRQENIEELVNSIIDFCDSRREEEGMNTLLSDYLSEISLLTDADSDKDSDSPKVTLMTVHSSKGLEFGTVFIVGMEENLFPSQLAGGSPREMEEERRLFYVAITRAKKHCFLSYAKSRFRYGKMEFGNPSRFITDISPNYLNFQSSMRSTRKSSYDDDVELPWKKRKTTTYTSQRPTAQPTHMPSSYPGYAHSSGTLRPIPRTESAPPTNNSANSSIIGTRVLHQKFGKGTIEKVEGSGDNLKATINFDNTGVKQLLLKFAKLQKIQ